MEIPRRWLLTASGTILAGRLAGCQSDGTDGVTTGESPGGTASTTAPESITTTSPDTTAATPADTTTPTDGSDDSPTSTPNLDAIRPFAKVRAQPSRDTPGTILAGLTNHGTVPVSFNYGPRLFLSFRPPDAVKLVEYRDILEHRNGCWRLDPDEPTITVMPTSKPTELAPGESVSEDFHVYTPRDTDQCLPAGTYTFKERIAPHFDGEKAPLYLVFSLRVIVTYDGTLAVETTGPTPDST